MERGRMFIICLMGLLYLSSCNDLHVAGDINKTYTTEFNYPGSRIVPYNDPHFENKAQNKTINICKGNPSRNGFKCK